MKWTGKLNAEDGFGQFETDGPMIHFDSFKDFFYLQRLFDLQKQVNYRNGQESVVSAVKNFVGGLK